MQTPPGSPQHKFQSRITAIQQFMPDILLRTRGYAPRQQAIGATCRLIAPRCLRLGDGKSIDISFGARALAGLDVLVLSSACLHLTICSIACSAPSMGEPNWPCRGSDATLGSVGMVIVPVIIVSNWMQAMAHKRRTLKLPLRGVILSDKQTSCLERNLHEQNQNAAAPDEQRPIEPEVLVNRATSWAQCVKITIRSLLLPAPPSGISEAPGLGLPMHSDDKTSARPTRRGHFCIALSIKHLQCRSLPSDSRI
jgi:hypothetical protein